jgi:organic hydroperoxide reductase OsmC/OhrA
VQVELEMGERSPIFKNIHIIVRARVPGIKDNQFSGLVNAAKNGCLLSRLLNVSPTMDAQLDSAER